MAAENLGFSTQAPGMLGLIVVLVVVSGGQPLGHLRPDQRLDLGLRQRPPRHLGGPDTGDQRRDLRGGGAHRGSGLGVDGLGVVDRRQGRPQRGDGLVVPRLDGVRQSPT